MALRITALRRLLSLAALYAAKIIGIFCLYGPPLGLFFLTLLSVSHPPDLLKAISTTVLFGIFSYAPGFLLAAASGFVYFLLVFFFIHLLPTFDVTKLSGALIGCVSGALVGFVLLGAISDFIVVCASAGSGAGFICGWRLPIRVSSLHELMPNQSFQRTASGGR